MSDSVSRLNAALEGRYVIERELGEGGMATVYLANDLRHQRKVALKVLKSELAAVVGAERFLAEIKTTANLQHPHILPLFDSGEADGFLFYVMPYVAGETLQDRVEREKQLPVDEAVKITTDLAEALDYAHRQNIIHRDIKPANILMHEGRPLIADFGIALAVGAAGGGRLTETGLSLGTPYYMSPEQATGDQTVGAATDIYALGAVLYEMLVGDPPYMGSTPQAILGKIIAGKIASATEERASVPANVDATIRKSLEKLPADRFTGAQEFARALADSGFRHAEPAGAASGRAREGWRHVAVAVASLFVGSMLGLGWSLRRPEPPMSVERFAAPFGWGDEPAFSGPGDFAMSPDGSMLVYRGSSDLGNQLWVRRWDDLEPSLIRGTERAGQIAVSPDGQEVAFVQGGEIKVVSPTGAVVRTLIEGRSPRWGPDGDVYATSELGIVRVFEAGGPAEPVTELAAADPGYGLTDVLPDGRIGLIVATLPGSESEIRALRFDTGEMRPLTVGTAARYVASGHLLYLFGGNLMAASFDARAIELRGPPVALIEGVSAYSISDAGKLFYSEGGGGAQQQMEAVWVRRSGQATLVEPGWSFDAGGGNWSWSLSPDGRRIALRATSEGNEDIWIKTLDGGPFSRLTFDEAQDWSPRWTPDGKRVTFISSRASGPANRDVWIKNADGTGQPEMLYDHESTIVEVLWAADGDWLLLRGGSLGAGLNTRDIFALRPGADQVALALLTEEYDEQQPALSPDGRWLAYISNETDRYEVFVRPFPDVANGKRQVSTAGGSMPVWAHSGRELFFMDSNRDLISAHVDGTTSDFRVSARETLFRIQPVYTTSTVAAKYDVAPDDQRFLMARFYQESGASRFVLVNNFFEELRDRVPN